MDYQHDLSKNRAPDAASSLFKMLDVPMCVTDSDGNFTHVNDAICRLYGYERSELVGQCMTLILPEQERDRQMGDYHSLGNVDVVVPHEATVLRKDGTEINLFVSGTRIHRPDGNPVQVTILFDISDSKKNNEMVKRFGRIFDQSNDEVLMFSADTLQFSGANRSARENLGYTLTELASRSVFDVAPLLSTEQFTAIVEPLLTGEKQVLEYETDFRRKDGTEYAVEVRLQYLANENPGLFVAVSTDISERRSAEAFARLSAQVFNNTREGILVTDAEGVVIFVNRGFSQITGYTEKDLIGGDTSFLRNDFNAPDYFAQMWLDIRENGAWQDEIWGVRKDGLSYAQRLKVYHVTDSRGRMSNYIFSIVDITEEKHVQERMQHLAYHDPLTDLPNRVHFNEKLADAVSRAGQDGRRVAIMVVNIDRFKNINKTFGQIAGNNFLRSVADRFKEIFSHPDIVCHFGGDEFVVMSESFQVENQIRIVAETALVYLNKPYRLHDFEIHATARIGISVYPEHGKTAEMLLRNAEAALNEVVKGSGPRLAFYSRGLNTRAIERMKIENGLREVVARNELFLHYQPQVDMISGAVVGAEALIRWNSPRRGLIPPGEFIPIAEDTGMIIPIGDWVLRSASTQFAQWQDLPALRDARIAVNISALQFSRSGLVHSIESIIRETGIRPDRLELELTETAVMLNIDESILVLKELKNLGISIAVDDFGTGYSSLSYLRKFPIDRLKIDRSFIMDIGKDPANNSIIDAIISLARGMSLEVVAEGVETEWQADFLRDRGCSIAQGYWYSPAISAESFRDYVESDTWKRTSSGTLLR